MQNVKYDCILIFLILFSFVILRKKTLNKNVKKVNNVNVNVNVKNVKKRKIKNVK